MSDHEHIDNAEEIALRIILACVEENVHGTADTFREVLTSCRGCDRCWLELVKYLAAYASAGWSMVDFDLYLDDDDEHDVAVEVLRKEAVAAIVANELAAVLDGSES